MLINAAVSDETGINIFVDGRVVYNSGNCRRGWLVVCVSVYEGGFIKIFGVSSSKIYGFSTYLKYDGYFLEIGFLSLESKKF